MMEGDSMANAQAFNVELTGYVPEQTVDAAELCSRIALFEEWLALLKEQVCEKPEGTKLVFSDLTTYFVWWVTDPALALKSDDPTLPQPPPIHRPGKCGGP